MTGPFDTSMILSAGKLRISPGFKSKIQNWAKKPSKRVKKCQKVVKKCQKVREMVRNGKKTGKKTKLLTAKSTKDTKKNEIYSSH